MFHENERDERRNRSSARIEKSWIKFIDVEWPVEHASNRVTRTRGTEFDWHVRRFIEFPIEVAISCDFYEQITLIQTSIWRTASSRNVNDEGTNTMLDARTRSITFWMASCTRPASCFVPKNWILIAVFEVLLEVCKRRTEWKQLRQVINKWLIFTVKCLVQKKHLLHTGHFQVSYSRDVWAYQTSIHLQKKKEKYQNEYTWNCEALHKYLTRFFFLRRCMLQDYFHHLKTAYIDELYE